jgi:hypothetical protein
MPLEPVFSIAKYLWGGLFDRPRRLEKYIKVAAGSAKRKILHCFRAVNQPEALGMANKQHHAG